MSAPCGYSFEFLTLSTRDSAARRSINTFNSRGATKGDAAANLLRNPHFAVGTSGWQVVEAYARGTTWSVESYDENGNHGGLVLRASDAEGASTASVLVYSPRTPGGGPGRWTGGVRLRASRRVPVDVAVVADGFVMGSDAPYQAPPMTTGVADPDRITTIEASRQVPDWARSVGLRVSLPIGVDVHIEQGWLNGPVEPDPLVGASVGIALDEPDPAFADGAVVELGGIRCGRVLVETTEGGPDTVGMELRLVDCYRGDATELTVGELTLTDRVTSVPFELPTDRPGVWRLETEITAGGATRGAELRYLVDADTEPVVRDPDGPWAVTANPFNTERTARLLRLLGVAHTRFYLGFSNWDLDASADVAEGAVGPALRAVLDLLPVATGSPAGRASRQVGRGGDGLTTDGWPDFRLAATVGAKAPTVDLEPPVRLLEPFAGMTVLLQPGRPRALEDWGDVVRTVATGVTDAPVGRAWAAANEPDLNLIGGDAGESPEEFAVAQVLFAAAIRDGDPDAAVVGPVIADGWDSHHQTFIGWEFIRRWAEAGGLDAVDVVAVQSHMIEEGGQAPEREDFEGLVMRLRAFVDRLGGEDKPLWDTEMGWRSDEPARGGFGPSETGPYVSEADQADLLVRAAVLGTAAGLDRFYAFHLHGFRELGEGCRFDWGLVSGSVGGPKAAFMAIRQLTRATGGCRRGRRLDTADRTRAVVFEGDSHTSAVVWQWTGGPGLWRLDHPPPGVRLYDLMGAPTTGADLRRPVFVRWGEDTDLGVAWIERCLAERYPL